MSYEPDEDEIEKMMELCDKTEARLEKELTAEQWQGVQEYLDLSIELQKLDGR